MYTIYSILFIVFIILIIVTAFITIALTYFQLVVEDWRCVKAHTHTNTHAHIHREMQTRTHRHVSQDRCLACARCVARSKVAGADDTAE